VNVFVDEFSFVDKTITKPDVDRVETADDLETLEPHFFVNLSQRTIAITFSLANVALGERPFSVGVLHHGEVYHSVDTLKHETSSGDLCAMTLFLPLTSS